MACKRQQTECQLSNTLMSLPESSQIVLAAVELVHTAASTSDEGAIDDRVQTRVERLD
ncbi:MAG: hypothetical protein V3R25_07050 [Nitrosomonadaceae bacterium]